MSTDDWVPPGTFRRHAEQLLIETPLTRAELAVHTGLAPRALDALLDGREGRPVRQIHISTARALAAATVESLREDAAGLADADPARDLLRSLLRLGHSRTTLVAGIGPEVEVLLDSSLPRRCTAKTWVQVAACYDQLTRPAPPPKDGDNRPPRPPEHRARPTSRQPTARAA